MVKFLELTQAEERAIEQLLKLWAKLLDKLGYNNYTILVRDGNNGQKSVAHLHYHLIPNHHIGDLNSSGRLRQILDPKAE